MLKTLSIATLGTAMLLAGAPAIAQDTATDETETTGTGAQAAETEGTETDAAGPEAAGTDPMETEATDGAGQTAGGDDTDTRETGEFDLGSEVEEDPTYVKEEYGDWQMRCFRTQAEEDPCQMFQLLRDGQGNPTAEFTIFRLNDDSPAVAGATITAPLFTLLTEEVKISVDGSPAKSYPFRFCSQGGCVAQIGLTEADVNAFKRGAEATVTIVPAQAPDQKVGIAASLSGFTAAYGNVSVIEN